jgi:hypothetical protein
MYTWIWHRLPGTRLVKAATAASLMLAAVVLLWLWIFPWLYTHVPLDSVGFAA